MNSYETAQQQALAALTLRDYFAAAALTGHTPTLDNALLSAMTESEAGLLFLNAAALSYRLADAMLAEREK